MSVLSPRVLMPLLVAAALLLFPGCRKSSKAVAQVGDATISQAVWTAYRSEQPRDADPQLLIKDLITLEVAWQQADRKGLLKGQDWLEASKKIRRKVLTRAYLESLPGRRAPSEEEVKGFFMSHGEERHVLHLLVRSEDAGKMARRRLEKGEAFEKVALAVSVDPSVAKNKGDLGWIKRETVVPEFAKEAFSAKEGSLCGPFRSEFGWHVALVKERRSPTAEQFEKDKGRLMAQARDMAIKPLREGALEPLRPKYPVTVDENVLALNPTEASAAVDGMRVVGRVCGTNVTLRELQRFTKEAMGPGGPDHNLSPNTRRRFLEMFSDDLRLEAAAEKAGVAKRPEVEASLWLDLHQAVSFGFGRNYLRNLKLTDADLAAFHKANPEKFRSVGSVKVYLLVANDAVNAGLAAQEAAKGLPWKTLVARFANRESTGNWDPGFLEVAALKKILPADAVKSLTTNALDSIVGPVESPEGPMLFQILERKPGDVLPFEQCRDTMRTEYLASEGVKLVNAYLNGEARKDLRIQVHQENLKP